MEANGLNAEPKVIGQSGLRVASGMDRMWLHLHTRDASLAPQHPIQVDSGIHTVNEGKLPFTLPDISLPGLSGLEVFPNSLNAGQSSGTGIGGARMRLAAVIPLIDIGRRLACYTDPLNRGYKYKAHLPKTLDDACHEFLEPDDLASRDNDQVVSRYLKKKHYRSRTGQIESQGINIISPTPEERIRDLEGTAPSVAQAGSRDDPHILTVSPLWLYSFQIPFSLAREVVPRTFALPDHVKDDLPVEVVLSTYPQQALTENIQRRLNQDRTYMDANDTPAWIITACVIIEESIKFEPQLPYNSGHYLDAFASEIAYASGEVAKAYACYKHSLGDTAKNFKKAISRETDYLLTIDDILDELSMIRRVHGERTSVCRDLLEKLRLYHQPLVMEVRDRVEQLTQKQRMKLIRLEEDAQRIRKSLVTLLDLRQRQVATEGVINSEFQNQILFVFTALTVVFTPLSWVTGLMALNIQSFTPEPQSWSRVQAFAASFGTLVGSIALIIVFLLSWWWYEKWSDAEDSRDGTFHARKSST